MTASRLTSNPDSITFTTEQLVDLIVCVSYAMREGVGYGHVAPEEQAPLEAERATLLAKLEKFAKSAAKRNACSCASCGAATVGYSHMGESAQCVKCFRKRWPGAPLIRAKAS